jgi:hypothetical protein
MRGQRLYRRMRQIVRATNRPIALAWVAGGLVGGLLVAEISDVVLAATLPGRIAGAAEVCVSCADSGRIVPSDLGAPSQVRLDLPVESALPFAQGLAAIKVGGRWGYIDKSGNLVIPLQFEDAGSFSNIFPVESGGLAGGMAPVKIDGRWGYINKSGSVVIQPQFNYAKSFFSGLGAVQVGERWGFVDPTGRMVVSPRFESAEPHYDTITTVQLDGRWGFIDRTGRVVIDFLPPPPASRP